MNDCLKTRRMVHDRSEWRGFVKENVPVCKWSIGVVWVHPVIARRTLFRTCSRVFLFVSERVGYHEGET